MCSQFAGCKIGFGALVNHGGKFDVTNFGREFGAIVQREPCVRRHGRLGQRCLVHVDEQWSAERGVTSVFNGCRRGRNGSASLWIDYGDGIQFALILCKVGVSKEPNGILVAFNGAHDHVVVFAHADVGADLAFFADGDFLEVVERAAVGARRVNLDHIAWPRRINILPCLGSLA